jgi:hypothetical protein
MSLFKTVLASQTYSINKQKMVLICNADIYLINSCFVENVYHFYYMVYVLDCII